MRDRHHRWGCCRDDHPRIGRRELIQAGSLSLLGTGLADLFRLDAMAATESRARVKSVVFIFQSGGPSQHETFDPKPEAPDKVRGEYGTISTKNVDLNVCECGLDERGCPTGLVVEKLLEISHALGDLIGRWRDVGCE